MTPNANLPHPGKVALLREDVAHAGNGTDNSHSVSPRT